MNAVAQPSNRAFAWPIPERHQCAAAVLPELYIRSPIDSIAEDDVASWRHLGADTDSPSQVASYLSQFLFQVKMLETRFAGRPAPTRATPGISGVPA